jgi:hypothetical protein
MVCSATGLSIISRPDWIDRRFGNGYRLTCRMIGNRIILTQPSSITDLESMAESLDLTDAIIREAVDPSAGYVQLSDDSGMRRITREARRHYLRRLRSTHLHRE